MKKVITAFLLCAFVLTLTACGGEKPHDNKPQEDILITRYEESYGVNDERNYYYSFDLPEKVTRLKMPDIFGDHMVFQQNKPMRIWGLAPADSKIEVRLYNEETNENVAACGVISAADHSFVCELPARAASFTSYRLKITCGTVERVYSDVLIGEVFLASGQSNMQVIVGETYEGEELLSSANNDKIRVYNPAILPNQGDNTYSYRLQLETPNGTDGWSMGNDATTYGMYSVSAVGYSCALQLFEELNRDGQIPVGFLNLPVGGTSVKSWLPRSAVEENAALKRALGASYLTYDEDKTLNYGEFTALFNAKIAPVVNFNISGMIWYQGETDEGAADMYRLAIESLITAYGTEFRFEEGKMPVVMCHIAPFNTGAYENIVTKTVQFNAIFDETEQKSPETRAVVALYDSDLRYMMGDYATIHPRVKELVGRRCGKALYSIACTNGGVDGYDSPSYLSSYEENGSLFVRFADCGEGLFCDGELKGFAVAGADKKFYAATAEILSTDTVKLSSEYVAEPKYCSYAYSNLNMKSNLKNKQGFAARPFCNADGVSSLNYYCQHDWLDCDGLTAWRYLPSALQADGSTLYQAKDVDLYRTDKVDLSVNKSEAVRGGCLQAQITGEGASVAVILDYPYDVHQFNRFTSFSVYVKSETAALVRVEAVGNEAAVLSPIGTSLSENGYIRYDFSLENVTVNGTSEEGYSFEAWLKELRFVFSGTGTAYIDEMSLGNL